MSLQDALRLIALSAIWGASFLFTRVSVPVLGPAYLVVIRVGLAALFLCGLGFYLKKNLEFSRNAKHYFILGFFNSAFPFLLFSYAALSLSVSILSVLNATSPTWGLLIGILLKQEKATPKKLIGLALGVVGVAVLFSTQNKPLSLENFFPIFLGLLASFCYGVATNYAKRAKTVEPYLNAYGSMVASVILILPALFFVPMRGTITINVSLSMLMLGVLCSGIAYLIYFKLISSLGPTSALTVTFLIPVFGTLWGYLFLDETITGITIFGMLIIVISTALVTNFSFKSLRKSSAT